MGLNVSDLNSPLIMMPFYTCVIVQVKWSRNSRTDKGVHSLSTVVRGRDLRVHI